MTSNIIPYTTTNCLGEDLGWQDIITKTSRDTPNKKPRVGNYHTRCNKKSSDCS